MWTAANKRNDFPLLIKLMDRGRAGGGAAGPAGRFRGPERVIGRTHGHKSLADTTGGELPELPGVTGGLVCVAVCVSVCSSRQDRKHDPAEEAATVVSKHSPVH